MVPPASASLPQTTVPPESTVPVQSTIEVESGRTHFATEAPESTRIVRSTVAPAVVPEQTLADVTREVGTGAAEQAPEEGGSPALLAVNIVMLLIFCGLFAFAMYRESVRKARAFERKKADARQPDEQDGQKMPVV
jgi:Pyruvate/2-oxoacid:ferredoxin oxidoreductase gamma subunit